MFILSYYFSADFPFFVYIYIYIYAFFVYIGISELLNNITFQDSPDGPVVSTALPLQEV